MIKLVLLFIAVINTLPISAQPTVQWQKFAGYSSTGEGVLSTVQLSANRLVSVGTWSPGTPGLTSYPLVALTRANGDTIRLLRIYSLADVNFKSAALADGGDFYAFGQTQHDSTNVGISPHSILCRFDSLGNLRWRQFYQVGAGEQGERMLSLPDGALLTSTGNGLAQVRRVDGRGRTRWVRAFGRTSNCRDLVALTDGSFALLANDPNRFPPPHTVWNTDGWLLKLTVHGDTLASAYVGDSARRELLSRLIATTDGGVAVVGLQCIQPANQPRRGILFKLDANWHEQWRYWFAPPMGDYDSGGDFYTVNELTNGHFLLSGLERIRGHVSEVAAPGIPVWTWVPPQLPGSTGWPKATEFLPVAATGAWRAFGFGIAAPGHAVADIWLAQLGNLPAPATVNLCATPPGPPVATFQAAGAPGILRFTLDVAATSAGPPYAEISRVTWQWGDGTPADTGRAVTHVFASPQPVRVRCTITNNLFCTSTTDIFPYGPLGVADELAAAVSIYPNPSATGRFTLHADAAAGALAFTVTDGVGRRVATGALDPARATAELDLRAHPAGVYALRLTGPDGRTHTRKLITW